MHTLRNLTAATTLVALTAVGGFSPAAHAAAHIRNCGTTTTPTDVTNPPSSNAGFTSTTTTSTTQTPACNSNSDTNQETTPISTGPTTNKGGGTPGGFNK